MTITPNTIITAAALLTAIGGITATMVKLIHWIDRQKQQDGEIGKVKEEQCVIVYGLLACLDGLKQLGANGNVTKAHEMLEKHINQSAHKPTE